MDNTLSDDEQRTPHQAFSDLIAARIAEAQAARTASGIEDQWREDEDQYEGIDNEATPEQREANKSEPFGSTVQSSAAKKSRVVLNITQPKTDIAAARVQEILLPHDDRPWEAGPTPIPEMDDVSDQTMLTLADGTQAPAELVSQVVLDKAKQASAQMSTWIEDKFIEGGVYGELRKLIRGAAKLGSAVLKGPYAVTRTVKKWRLEGNVATLEVLTKVEPTSKCISVWDFWHDPACGDSIHDGAYVAERDYLTARQLRKMAAEMGQDGQPVYHVECIADALKEGPGKIVRDHRGGKRQGAESEVFEVYHYSGDVGVDDLEMMGVDTSKLSETERALMAVPATVTMLNGRAIRATLQPVEMGDAFAYDVFTWDPVEGRVWGKGVPRKMRVAARMLNAAIRKLLENAGLSAGPQVVFAEGCITPAAGGKYRIEGRSAWKFTPNDVIKRVQDAFAVFNIPSMQRELAEIIEFALRMADELTNLPVLLQGMQGSAPDTVGGMAMLLNNSNSPLRVIGKQFDDQIVVPHLGRYNDWGMQAAPPDCRGDHQIKARGSSVLVRREEAKQALMQMAPTVKDPAFRVDPQKWFTEVLRSVGIDPASIQYDDATWKRVQESMQQGQPQDPRIEAAHIRNEGIQVKADSDARLEAARQAFEAEQRSQDRELQAWIAEIEREIEAMQLAADQNIELDRVKAMLAGKAMDIRSRGDEMRLKTALGSGI